MATVLEKTWFSQGNVVLPGVTYEGRTQEFYYRLKEFMLGKHAGAPANFPKWTMVGSSNAVTAGLDGVDRWTAPNQIPRRTSATGPTPWVAMRSPDGYTYAVIYWEFTGSSPTNQYSNFRMILASSTPTGGSTTALPTISGVDSRVAVSIGRTGPGVVGCRLHMALTSDGSLCFCLNEIGLGQFNTLVFAGRIADARVEEAFPWFIYADGLGGTTGIANPNNASHTANGVLSGSSTSKGWSVRNFANSGNQVARALALWNPEDTVIVAATLASDPNDPPGTRPDCHLWLTSGGSVRGRIADVRLGPDNMAHGTTDSLTDPRSFTVGNLWLPIGVVPDMS